MRLLLSLVLAISGISCASSADQGSETKTVLTIENGVFSDYMISAYRYLINNVEVLRVWGHRNTIVTSKEKIDGYVELAAVRKYLIDEGFEEDDVIYVIYLIEQENSNLFFTGGVTYVGPFEPVHYQIMRYILDYTAKHSMTWEQAKEKL